MDDIKNKSQDQEKLIAKSSATPRTALKTRSGSGYLKQLYSTARNTVENTHSNLKNLTTFLVNFVPTDKVDASELQVRTHFEDSEIEALAHSIKEHGVLQPILVIQNGDRYKVIAGERRLRASKQAGLDRIPARVLNTDDKGTHEVALRENLDRVDLHPIEEGEGYSSLLTAQLYPSHDAIAKAFGKPKSRITECIGFTKLPPKTKEELLKKKIKNRALLRMLLSIPEPEQFAIIQKAAEKEEVIPLQNGSLLNSKAKKIDDTSQPSAEMSFHYKCTKKGFTAPKFKWKPKNGKEALKNYIGEVKKMIAELEEKHL